jgi:2-methylcitrate dehydratase PrpD
LIRFCAETGAERIPAAVLARATDLFLDYVGVALGSLELAETSRIVTDLFAGFGGEPQSRIVGRPAKVPAPSAAFANAAVHHAIELDDTHSGASLHPGTCVIPAAVAVAEARRAGGRDVLRAMVLGYEVAVRLGRALDPQAHYRRGFHPTSTCGAFGAAVAAGSVLGLKEEQLAHALGIAGSFAAGNIEFLNDGSLTKRIQPGVAAWGGTLAALLAERGYTGPRGILEGSYGFLRGYSDAADAARLSEGLGEGFALMETGIKPHACCRYCQSPIDGALALRAEHRFAPEAVAKITVGLVRQGIKNVAEDPGRRRVPATVVDAQFSLYHCVAAALVLGHAFVEAFQPERLADPTIRDVARRIEAVHDPKLEAVFPRQWPAWVTVRLRDGAELTVHVGTSKGDPENPLTRQELQAKFRALAGRRCPPAEVDRLWAACAAIADVLDVNQTSELLATETSSGLRVSGSGLGR